MVGCDNLSHFVTQGIALESREPVGAQSTRATDSPLIRRFCNPMQSKFSSTPPSARLTAIFLLLGSSLSSSAFAACGASFCTLTTTPEAAHERVGQIRLDFSYEYIDLGTPFTGKKHGDGQQHARLPDGDVETVHRELDTVGHRLGLRTSAGVADRLTMELYLPFLARAHQHFAFEEGSEAFGKFKFSGIGDITVTGRYSVLAPQNPDRPTLVVGIGVKTPTGSATKLGKVFEGGDAVRAMAERSIQPGSGSWDPIFSAYYLQRFQQISTFANGTIRLPTGHDGYEFGTETLINLGASYPVLPGIETILQFNFRVAGRDDSDEETALFNQNTGGEYVFISPGLRMTVAKDLSMYAFAQLPIYRNVNGGQLTADWSISAGISYAFKAWR